MYKSSKTEVLGKPMVRNYKFPSQVQDAEFAFGKPTQASHLIR